MKIGLSLPVSYLVGRPEDARTYLYRQILGPAPAFLETAGRWGLTHVELRGLGPESPADLAHDACRTVRQAGLGVTVHAVLPDDAGRPLAESYPALAACLDAEADPMMVPVHALSADEGSMAEYAARTRECLALLLDTIAERDLPLRVALENNRFRNRCDPGATASGILRMLDGLAPDRIGACWDFGHMYANVRQGVEPADPDAAFVARVIHAHVHDVTERTHQPLTVGNVPLARWMGRLARAGYDGVYDLELNPERFDEDALAATEASVRILREAIARVTEGGAHEDLDVPDGDAVGRGGPRRG